MTKCFELKYVYFSGKIGPEEKDERLLRFRKYFFTENQSSS